MKHLKEIELSALMDGALAGEKRARAERHLGVCESCRAALASLAEQDHALGVTLAHDPGEAYFDRFAGRVMERLPAGRARVAPAPPSGLSGWFSDPRRLAWAGGVAALIVGAGLAFLTTRENERVLERGVMTRSGERPAPAPVLDQGRRSASRSAPPSAPLPAADVEPPRVGGATAQRALESNDTRRKESAGPGAGAPGRPENAPPTTMAEKKEAAMEAMPTPGAPRAGSAPGAAAALRRDARGEEKRVAPVAPLFAQAPEARNRTSTDHLLLKSQPSPMSGCPR